MIKLISILVFLVLLSSIYQDFPLINTYGELARSPVVFFTPFMLMYLGLFKRIFISQYVKVFMLYIAYLIVISVIFTVFFILRVEDTDQNRYVEGSGDYIQEALEWCGMIPDEGPKNGGNFGPYKQSLRKSIYKEHIDAVNEQIEMVIIDNKCKLKINVNDKILKKFGESYPDLHFHIRNSTNLIDVGKNLGLSSKKTFLKIILPSARPAIVVGLSLVAMETLSDFGTVSFFSISTLTTAIYNAWIAFDDLSLANRLSFFLLILNL